MWTRWNWQIQSPRRLYAVQARDKGKSAKSFHYLLLSVLQARDKGKCVTGGLTDGHIGTTKWFLESRAYK